MVNFWTNSLTYLCAGGGFVMGPWAGGGPTTADVAVLLALDDLKGVKNILKLYIQLSFPRVSWQIVVNVSTNMGTTTEVISGSSSKKDVKVMFELIHSHFTNLNFDQDSYDAAIEKQNAFMANIMSRPVLWLMGERGGGMT